MTVTVTNMKIYMGQMANIIGTQAGSGPPFYLPARLATIENRLQKVETTQDHHTECFKVLFDHFKIPFPAPAPPAASPAASPGM